MSAAPLVYVDSNALIAIVEAGNLMHDFVECVADGAITLVTSELTLTEVLVKPMRDANADLAQTYERVLGDADFIRTEAIRLPLLRDTARIRAETGNKIADAIHVATAVASGSAFIVSSDQRLRTPPTLARIPVDVAADRRLWPW